MSRIVFVQIFLSGWMFSLMSFGTMVKYSFLELCFSCACEIVLCCEVEASGLLRVRFDGIEKRVYAHARCGDAGCRSERLRVGG